MPLTDALLLDPAPVTCGAVNLGGSFIALRRVRAINFCTQAAAECFVLGLAHETNPVAASYLPTGTFNVIEDCILEQPGENNTHETTLISSVGDGYSSARSPVVRRNYVNCEYSLGSSELVAVDSYTRVDDHHFKLTTKRPHNRVVGQNIRLNGAPIAGEPNPTPPFYFFQDTFKISAVDPTTGEITCYSPGKVPTELLTAGSIGVDFHGPAALSGTGSVTEGNAVYDCLNAYYTDTGSTRDAVVRDNYYSSISLAVNFNFNPVGSGLSAPQAAKSLTRSIVNGEFIATFEIADDTPLLEVSLRDVVTVSGALIGGLPEPAAPYNGTFSVVSVSADRRIFSYEMKSGPPNNANADPPTAAHPIAFQSRWQVRRLIYESNLCDLYAFDANTVSPPLGISTYGYLQGPPFMFPESVHRDNIFRLIDGAPAVARANGAASLAFNLYSSEDALVEGNLIGIVDPYVMLYSKSRNINLFNNLTLAGKAVPLTEDTSGSRSTVEGRSTLDDMVSDALVLSLL